MSRSTVPAWLSAVAAAQPDRPAVIGDDATWTYREFDQRSSRIAAGLLGSGDFDSGSRVGLVGLNSPEYLAAYFGVLRAGGVVVPLNGSLTATELVEQLGFVDAAGCIQTAGAPALDGVGALWPIEDLGGGEERLPTIDPAADAIVLLTSGTTGAPKGVVHSHAGLLHAALQMTMGLPFARDDVNIAFLPFFASIAEQVLPTLLAGGALRILPRFDADRVIDACDGATTFDAVPTVVSRLLDTGAFGQLNKLRWIAFASEPMPPAVLERWWSEVPDVLTYEFYGMTEMLPVTHASPADLAEDPTSVGTPYSTSLVRVVDESLEVVPAGEEGEITCASPARMSRYLGDEQATRAALTPDGAMRTGDLGRMGEDGHLRLTGRLKDLIISGGINVAPAEIEAVACRHPDVATAAVVGIPDDRWGETPIVVAVASGNSGSTLTPDRLLDHCREILRGPKRPSGAAVVERLPVTGIGKSAKGELRESIINGEVPIVRAR